MVHHTIKSPGIKCLGIKKRKKEKKKSFSLASKKTAGISPPLPSPGILSVFILILHNSNNDKKPTTHKQMVGSVKGMEMAEEDEFFPFASADCFFLNVFLFF